MYADIALIELMNSVTFNTFIQPACLYQQYDTVPRKAWITGWGLTSFDGDKGSDQLLKAQLDVVDNLYCASQYNASEVILPYGIATSMICAGDPRNNWTRDSCKGDSGGPLQVLPESECLFQVIGIVSFGRGCALYQIPNVYTRVSYYLPWIEDNVWPHGQ
ncbi:SNAK protease, partial [Acromyrmex charruanus]